MVSISMGDRLVTPRAADINFHFNLTDSFSGCYVTYLCSRPLPFPDYVCELHLYTVKLELPASCLPYPTPYNIITHEIVHSLAAEDSMKLYSLYSLPDLRQITNLMQRRGTARIPTPRRGGLT